MTADPEEGASSRASRWSAVENGIVIVIVAATCLLPLIELVGRQTVSRGITGSIPLVQHLTLWIASLGAALAARSDSLLALSTAELLPARWRSPVRAFTSAVGVGVTGWLVVSSLDFVRAEREFPVELALGIPVWVALLVMPIGFLLVMLRLIRHASDGAGGRPLRVWTVRGVAAAGLVLPAVFTLGADAVQEAGLLWPAMAVIGVATVLGMPIFAAVSGAALLLFWSELFPVSSVALQAYQVSASPYLPAIPLFTLGGYILAKGGASRRLMRTFTALVGWLPGGLAIVTTLVLAFFTPLTGASGVTILSMGGLLLPILTEARYPERTSIGLVTVSGSIGLLLPPSLPVILYAVRAQVPIDRLFVAGLVPGMILIAVVAGWASARGWWAGAKRTPFALREAAAAVWSGKWELLLPVVLLLGYFGGYFASLVEAAAVTVAYAVVVECVIYKDLTFRGDLPAITVECAALVGAFFIILGAALGFNDYLVIADIPTLVTDWVRSQITSPMMFLLVLNILLIVVGALMDIYSAIFVVAPLVVPMGMAYGIDPIHLGVVFLANMELGYLMPPMGENLFLSSMRFSQPLTRIYTSTLPYVILLAIAVLLITYVPGLSLWLVGLL